MRDKFGEAARKLLASIRNMSNCPKAKNPVIAPQTEADAAVLGRAVIIAA